jgi:hypothetical protein
MCEWQPRHQWDHPEIAGALAKLNDIIVNTATVKELLGTADETDVVLVSGNPTLPSLGPGFDSRLMHQ